MTLKEKEDFLQWIENQDHSVLYIRDVLTQKKYVLKPIEDLLEIYKTEKGL